MRQSITVAGVALVAAGGIFWLIRPASPPPVLAASPALAIDDRDGSSHVAQKLQQILPRVRFAAVPFDEAIEQLRGSTGANIVVEWESLGENDRWNRKIPIDLDLREVSLARVLSRLVKVARNSECFPGYGIVDGIIVIGDETLVGQQSTVTRVYDVRDLLDSNVKWRSKVQRPNPGYLYSEVAADFTKLLTEMIETETWKENGGMIGSLREIDGRLVVKTSRHVQDEIVRLLPDLRHPARAEDQRTTTMLTSRPSTPSEIGPLEEGAK
jgi:hypothetical protein